jgi:uncharacterized RDD family membrane protein YckC
MMSCGVCSAPSAEDAPFCLACGAVAVSETVTPQPPLAGASQLDYRLAGFGSRLAATILDSILLISAFLLAGMAAVVKTGLITENGFSLTTSQVLLALAAAIGVATAYFSICEGLFGATMGKALAGIQVRKTGGARCSLGASLVRNLLRLVDAVGGYLFGFIVALFSKQRQRLGDQIAGTIVVERKLSRMARAGLIMLWLELLSAAVGGAFLLHLRAPAAESSTILVNRPAATPGPETLSAGLLEINGAARSAARPYRPGETVAVEYQLSGYSEDRDGRPRLNFNVLASDPTGLAMHQPWANTFNSPLQPGTPVYGNLRFTIPAFAPPGEYRVVVWARDYLNNRDMQTAASFQVQAPAVASSRDLDVRDFALSLTPDGPAEDAPRLHGGGVVYMRCNLFGMRFRSDQVSGRIALRIVGPSGHLVLDQPKYVDIHATVLYHPASLWLPVHGDLQVPAALEKGVYTEEFTVVDNIAGRAIRQEARFVVK